MKKILLLALVAAVSFATITPAFCCSGSCDKPEKTSDKADKSDKKS